MLNYNLYVYKFIKKKISQKEKHNVLTLKKKLKIRQKKFISIFKLSSTFEVKICQFFMWTDNNDIIKTII